MEAIHHFPWALTMGTKLNDWVAHTANVAVLLAILLWSAIMATALDRERPFIILPHDPVTIKAGTYVVIDLPVWRDLTRRCDAKLDRYLFDGAGARFDLTTGAHFSDATIRSFPPGRLVIKFDAPPLMSDANNGGMVPGAGRIVADLRYYCTKGHIFWPISVQAVIPIVIEP